MQYDSSGRALAQSGSCGPESTRDRPVDLEIVTGELGCGELTMELKLQLERVAPGAQVRIVTADPGAPRDLPAWCRMTGHRLLEADAPFYIIQARDRDRKRD
ncbi:MAG: sulfurtransferase TusA family protein [bacterium]